MTEEDERFHAMCPLCLRIASYDSPIEAVKTLVEHNQDRHEGEKVARLVKENRESLREFLEYVRDEHGIETYGEMGARIVEVDPMGVIPG